MISDFTSWEDTLVHHGIKGMKWGIRRFQNEDGSRTAQGRRRYSKNPSRMSDAELKAGIKRAELEKKYRELTKPPSKVLTLVNNIMEARKKYSEMETERIKAETQKAQAMANYARTKADIKVAKSNARRAKFESRTYRTRAKRYEEAAAKTQARIGLKRTNEEIGSKTIRGAIRRKVAGLITKGRSPVKETGRAPGGNYKTAPEIQEKKKKK